MTARTVNLRSSFGAIISVPYFVPAVVAVSFMIVLTSVQNASFFGGGGWQLVIFYASPLMVLAMAQTPALMSGQGGLDLSVGPAAGLISVIISGLLIPQGLVKSLPAIVVCALALGMLNGCLNGMLIGFLRVPPIIATLATYLIYGGLAIEFVPNAVGSLPDSMSWFSEQTAFIPNVGLVIIGLGFLWFVLMRSAYGRNLRAVGSNDRAAYTAGVRVVSTRFISYVLTGAGVGVGALLLMAVLGGADPTVGASYTLQSIAAAVLGGVSLMGGRGGVLGAAAGGLLIFMIQNYLTYMAVSTFVLQMVFGLALIFAIVVNGGWDYLRTRTR